MKRIDFETAVLLDEVIPDFGCTLLWVDDNTQYKRVADWQTWVVELERQGFKKYPMPYTEQIVEALRDEHLGRTFFQQHQRHNADLARLCSTQRA